MASSSLLLERMKNFPLHWSGTRCICYWMELGILRNFLYLPLIIKYIIFGAILSQPKHQYPILELNCSDLRKHTDSLIEVNKFPFNISIQIEQFVGVVRAQCTVINWETHGLSVLKKTAGGIVSGSMERRKGVPFICSYYVLLALFS